MPKFRHSSVAVPFYPDSAGKKSRAVMKPNYDPAQFVPSRTLAAFVTIGLLAMLNAPALLADTVIVYSRVAGGAINTFPPYQEVSGTFSASSGNSSVQNPSVQANGTRFGSGGQPIWQVQPTLGGTGHVYAVYVTVPVTTTTPDETVEVSTTDGTLSTNVTLAFATVYNRWNFITYLTNGPSVYQPTLTFTYSTITMYGTNQPPAASNRRVYTGPIMFDDITDQCKKTPPVAVYGPLASGQTNVLVAGVAAGATNITVYANGVQIGKAISGVTTGINSVAVSPLAQGAEIKATQTTNNIEGCIPTSGPQVGGGANPEIRVSFILSQNPSATGPIGSAGTLTANNYHLPATGTIGGGFAYPPVGGIVLTPATCWQTVSAQNGIDPEFTFNGSPGLPDSNPYAVLGGIAFSVENVTNTGPFNLYIDNIMNGEVMIQDFESATNGQSQVFLQNPTTATIPVSGLISQPDISVVTTNNADTGAKSLRFSWQWAAVADNIWIRALTAGSGTPNPVIDLSKPISMRVLLLPVGTPNGNLTVSAMTNVFAYPGANASFTATASGPGPFTYQWFTNGVAITDATNNTFGVTNVQFADSGIYALAVSNLSCSTTSSAILTVLPPIPIITNQPAHIVANVAGTANFSVGAYAPASIGQPILYQWQFNGADLLDKTNSSLAVPNVQVGNAGGYTVTVTNDFGSVTSVVAFLDVVPVGVSLGNGTGLRGDYFNVSSFATPAPPNAYSNAPILTRLDGVINFDFGIGSPAPGVVSNDFFTVIWSGQVLPLGAGTYSFFTTTDDGVRLWVAGQLLIDQWVAQPPTSVTNSIALGTNKADIVMEYFERGSGAVAKLSWFTTGVNPQIIPQSQLFPALPSPALKLESSSSNLVFNWSGPFFLQTATNITGPWGTLYNATSPYTNAIGTESQRFFRLQVQ
jgi:hypothetical protein